MVPFRKKARSRVFLYLFHSLICLSISIVSIINTYIHAHINPHAHVHGHIRFSLPFPPSLSFSTSTFLITSTSLIPPFLAIHTEPQFSFFHFPSFITDRASHLLSPFYHFFPFDFLSLSSYPLAQYSNHKKRK